MSEGTARACGITYRMLDYWTRKGWLRPYHDGGSGRDRQWPATELQVAREMGLLVKAGLLPAAAHRVARAGQASAVLALISPDALTAGSGAA